MIAITQDQYQPLMKAWQTEYDTTTASTLRPPYDEVRGWRKEGRLVIPPNLALKRKVMFHIHDALEPRHPNLSETLRQVAQLYWWPDMEAWVTKYVKNCEQCHHDPTAVRTTSPIITPLRSKVHEAQEQHRAVLKAWSPLHSISEGADEERGDWQKEGRLVIPPDETLKREILQLLHDAPTAGHPGRDETFAQVSDSYWWPGMQTWVTKYVTGCAICQQNKNITHRTRTPLYHIPTPENALPFQQIALDLITGLPPNGPYDSILTIVDHGCSRAAVFLPCATTITGPGEARLYFDNVYRWFGLPSKVISDRDPRFTSHFGRALTNKIGARQNLSTAFHPQTDGLSERKNQWIEQYLRLVANAQQGDWSRWLTVASAVHNDHVNSTLGVTPIEVLLGYRPTLHPDQNVATNSQTVEQRLETLHQKRAQAIAAINKVANQGPTPEGKFKEGDQVWLEASNLKLPYHTPKLAPRRQGPFRINKVISPVAYRLALPSSWGIHDVFHASLLLPYRETAAHGPNFARPPPDLIEGEEEYEVETIVNHRRHGRRCQLQYLIKWKGYPSSDNTWEAAQDVHVDDLVKTYHRRHPLESPGHKAGQGTAKLIRTLRSFALVPSPTHKAVSWLLHGTTSPTKPSLGSPLTLKSPNAKQSVSIGHLQLSSIPPNENTPSSTPAFVMMSTASTTPCPEPWLTHRLRNAIPLTSRPLTTRSQVVLTPPLLTEPNILTSTPPPRKLSTPHRGHPSLPKSFPPLNNSHWTAHPELTTTLAPSPPPSSEWSAPHFLMWARQRLETLSKNSRNSFVNAKGKPATASHNKPVGLEVSRTMSASSTSRSQVTNASSVTSTHASEPQGSSTPSPQGPGTL